MANTMICAYNDYCSMQVSCAAFNNLTTVSSFQTAIKEGLADRDVKSTIILMRMFTQKINGIIKQNSHK